MTCQVPGLPGRPITAAAISTGSAGSHNAVAITRSRRRHHTTVPASNRPAASTTHTVAGQMFQSRPASRPRHHANARTAVAVRTVAAHTAPATMRVVASVTVAYRARLSTATAEEGASTIGVNSTSWSITDRISRSPSATACWARLCVRSSGRPSIRVKVNSPAEIMPSSSAVRRPLSPSSASRVCSTRTRESTTAATAELAGRVTSVCRPPNSTATRTCSASRTCSAGCRRLPSGVLCAAAGCW